MLAPSGGGLIIYQAYGNLYAMTGIQCLEGHLEEIQRNLALWKKNNDKSTDLHQHLKNFYSEAGDGVTDYT
ncbi:hypothetical protein Tco_1190427 [Tanacetum coccineum]